MAKDKVPQELMYLDPKSLGVTAQARTDVDAKADAELLESVQMYGILQPILAREVAGKKVVIAGHRRTAAAIEAGLPVVPVLVGTADDEMIVALQLVENLQRSDMSLRDVADGVWDLYNGAAGGSAKLVGEMLGKTKSWVSKALLLSAPGKAHSVARKLMAADKLYDIELAYLICQVEALSKDAAEGIANGIENATRATVRKVLAALKEDADVQEGVGTGEGSASGDEGQQANTEAVDTFDLDMLTFIQRAVTDYVVSTSGMDVKRRTLAALAQAIFEFP